MSGVGNCEPVFGREVGCSSECAHVGAVEPLAHYACVFSSGHISVGIGGHVWCSGVLRGVSQCGCLHVMPGHCEIKTKDYDTNG